MNSRGHKRKAKEIELTLDVLLPDVDGNHVVAILELSYGMIQHIISFEMEVRYQEHIDTHVGLPKQLRRFKEIEIAEIFENLDSLRAGRWYGSKGNGDVVKKCIQYIEKVKKWSSYD